MRSYISYTFLNFATSNNADIENIGQIFAICLLNPADFVPNYRNASNVYYSYASTLYAGHSGRA